MFCTAPSQAAIVVEDRSGSESWDLFPRVKHSSSFGSRFGSKAEVSEAMSEQQGCRGTLRGHLTSAWWCPPDGIKKGGCNINVRFGATPNGPTVG